VKIVTLREALDILELNPNSLDRQLLESTLRKNLESIELRNVMRLLEAYRKANAFINPTLATHGDVRVTMIDEPIPDGPPLNQRPAAKRLSDESNQKLKRDFVPGATFDESILKAPRVSSPPTLSDMSVFATQEIMPSDLPSQTVPTRKPKNNVLITPEDRTPTTKGISVLWAGLTAVAGLAAGVFLVIPALSGFLPNNSGVQTVAPPAITKPVNTTKPVVSSNTTKPVVSSNTTSNTAQSTQATKLEAQKLAAQKLENQKLAAQKLAAQKLENQKIAAQKLENQKIAAQKLENQKIAAQKLAAQKLEAQKAQAAKPNTSTFTPNNTQVQTQAALRAAQRRAEIRAEANRRFLAQQRLEAQRLANQRAEQLAATRRAEQLAATRRAEQLAATRRAEQLAAARIQAQQAATKRANQQAAAKRASVSVRSINQGSFTTWDRSGAVLRYSSWAAIPDSVRALPTAQFRAQVYVASSPANLPGLPR
jgi:chemotaxis protein histidine kinase CheA